MIRRAPLLHALCLGLVLGAAPAAAPVGAGEPGLRELMSPGTGDPLAGEIDFAALKTLGTAVARIHRDYVDPVETRELVEGALKGMLEVLDPHSAYYPPAKHRQVREVTRGSFGGIGITVAEQDGALLVYSVRAESPAGEAGLRQGDRIVRIDETDARALSIKEAIPLMRGAVGTEISLALEGPDRAGIENVTLTRTRIVIPSITAERIGQVGHIALRTFSQRTPGEVAEAIDTLRAGDPAPSAGWVLDLRGNRGGLLDASAEVAGLFLDGGLVVETRGRDGVVLDDLHAENGDALDGAPLVVLIDGRSASASEVVAGALQDHGRALVMGEPSYGKGTVQSITRLGEAGAIGFTIARYYTPGGRSIQARGIQPDVLVPDARVQLKPDTASREAELDDALAAEADAPADAAAPRDLITRDHQLARAVDALETAARLTHLQAN